MHDSPLVTVEVHAMLDSRRLLLLLVAASLLSSGAPASAQRSTERPAKPTPRATRPAAASQADPFLGVWRLSAEKSKYESGGPPKGFTRTYEDRGGGTIFMTTDATNAQGATTRSYLIYKRDGKPYPEAAAGAETIRLVTVKAVDRRTEELAFIVNGKPLENTTTITISPDGKTMTQVLGGKTPQGRAFTNTVVYEKQP